MLSETFSLALALSVGFAHAFEADHLVAVSALVTKRNSVKESIKDGIFWGLGHTSTIFLIGFIMMFGSQLIAEQTFSFLEAGVGLMLLILGCWRLWALSRAKEHQHEHSEASSFRLAYGVGAIHGLAGSGALMLVVLAGMSSVWEGFVYLLLFGVGSILGMLLASGVFSIPFSKKISGNANLVKLLTLFSAGLCIYFGGVIIRENLGF